MLPAGLLALLLAELGWLFFHRAPSAPHNTRFRRWIGRSWLRYALPSLIVLIVLGRVDALWRVPEEFDAMVDLLGTAPGEPWLLATYAGGMAGGMIVADAIAVWRRRRPGRRRWLPDYSTIEAGPGERGWGVALSLTAGLTEEPFFRLVLPLQIAQVTGDAVAGFAVAALLFGLAHRYQGWKGVLLTMLSAGVLTAVYIQTGSLLFVMALHAAIDLNLLVVQPALVRRFARGD